MTMHTPEKIKHTIVGCQWPKEHCFHLMEQIPPSLYNDTCTFCCQDVLSKRKKEKQRDTVKITLNLNCSCFFATLDVFLFAHLFICFFIPITNKKGKSPPRMAAEPTETHFVPGDQWSSLHSLMQLSVSFRELCTDLSSANAAEAKGNHKVSGFVCLYGIAL